MLRFFKGWRLGLTVRTVVNGYDEVDRGNQH